MAWYSFFKGESKPVAPVRSFSDLMGWFSFGKGSAAAISAEEALNTAAVRCAVSKIASSIGTTPIRLIETKVLNGRKRKFTAEDHWAHRLLADSPNTYQTAFEFIESMMIMALLGNGALAVKNVVNGQVRELLPVLPGSWRVEQMSNYEKRFVVTLPDNTTFTLSENEVFYFHGPSYNGYTGISAIETARKAIGIARSLEDQQLNLAGTGGRPSGVLTFENKMTDDTKEKLRSTWKERWGAGGEGGIAVLDGNAKFEPIALSLADSQFIENRRFQIEEIGRIFDINPIFLHQSDKAWSTQSVEQLNSMFMRQTLIPWMKRIESALNKYVLNNVSNLKFDFDEADWLRGDLNAQANYFQKALGSGGTPAWLSVNEVRAEEGRDPIDEEWADVPMKGGYETSKQVAPQEEEKPKKQLILDDEGDE